MKNRKKNRLFLIIFILCAILIFGITINKISKLEFTPIPEEQELIIETITIEPGDVLAVALQRSSLSNKDSNEILRELQKLVKLNKIQPGDTCEIVYSDDGNWTDFWYYPSGAEFYSLKKTLENTIISQKKTLTAISYTHKAEGSITSSLWNGMSASDVPADVILSFADIFAWKMDFLTDTREGDEFKVVYDIETVNKKGSKLSSKIIAAKYKSGSKVYDAFYFKTQRGEDGYFDKDGGSVKSAFLKAPLQFRRISSHFNPNRKHPILKTVRPHLGIDYAAPTGTPVSTIADGTVTQARYNGGYGNYVEIRHSNGYVTSYGHLSKYGKGIKKGVRVKQGQVVGYVGSTGLSTGPHLDFRIKKNGKFFNFLTMKQPPTTTLKGNDKKEFQDYLETTFKDF